MIKLSDYVARFLAKQEIKHVFVVAGGACLHLIDSIDAQEGIEFVCPHHEQAGAMAADAYARVTGALGAAIATSGPGATNMITGICCAYYDSVPVLYITGQVASFRLKKETGVRQLGFQETDVVQMVKPVTKYAALLTDPYCVQYELEKAVYLARLGRPGPVLIDIPDDFQRVILNEDLLEHFEPDSLQKKSTHSGDLKILADQAIELFKKAKRPVLILGWGIRLSGADLPAFQLVKKLGFPVVPTWGMLDFLPSEDPRLVGGFGLHGTRYGNFTVQNSDLILSIGTRLDTHETGSPLSHFAREAKKIIVDIDRSELDKFESFGMNADLLIEGDAQEFINILLDKLANYEPPSISDWSRTIDRWKKDFEICPESYYQEKALNPYVFIKALSQASCEGDTLLVDTGCAIAWVCQAFDFKQNQRMFAALNNTPMGYALPAAIAASLALGRKQVTCVVGDGSLMMNIQELATVIKYRLPVKIFLINNQGYSMIQQTQDQWLKSNYAASSDEGGLGFPDFVAVARAHGFTTVSLDENLGIVEKVREVMSMTGPVFCNLDIQRSHRVIPQVVFGRPIEDSGPLLDREVFLKNMIVKPVEASMKA